jgi:hypothetical protein
MKSPVVTAAIVAGSVLAASAVWAQVPPKPSNRLRDQMSVVKQKSDGEKATEEKAEVNDRAKEMMKQTETNRLPGTIEKDKNFFSYSKNPF